MSKTNKTVPAPVGVGAEVRVGSGTSIHVGSHVGSRAGSGTGSCVGPGPGSRAGSGRGSHAGSGTGSRAGIRVNARVDGSTPGKNLARSCPGSPSAGVSVGVHVSAGPGMDPLGTGPLGGHGSPSNSCCCRSSSKAALRDFPAELLLFFNTLRVGSSGAPPGPSVASSCAHTASGTVLYLKPKAVTTMPLPPWM